MWLRELFRAFRRSMARHFTCSSGRLPELEIRRRLVLVNTLSLVGIAFLLPFATLAFAQGFYFQAILDLVAAAALAAIIGAMKAGVRYETAVGTGLLVIGGFFLYLAFSGGPHGGGYFWSLMYPVACLFLLSLRRGTLLAGTYLVFTLLLTVNASSSVPEGRDPNFLVRFHAAYLMIFIMSYYTEFFRCRVQKELRESQSTLSAAQRIAHIGSWRLDLTTDHLYWSEELYRVLGVSRGTVPTRGVFLSRIHPKEREMATQVLEQALARKEPYEWEFHTMPVNGSVRTIRAYGAVIENQNGEPVAVVETDQDITDRKQMESRLFESQKMQAIGHLAGGIAHNFNNQLAAVLGYAELLRGQLSPDDKRYRYADKIVGGLHRAAELPRQLLAFARREQYRSRPVDLNRIVRNVIALLRHSTDRRYKTRQDLAKGRLVVWGNQAQLQNVLLNIALNAKEAMPEGGLISFATSQSDAETMPSVLRETKDRTERRYVVMSVSDEGQGMSAEVLPHIFEPFFTTKGMARSQGMGLAAAYSIIRNHGGYIDVESTLGKGTKFTIFLPVFDDTFIHSPREAGKPEAVHAHLLVVDDEAPVRETTAETLREIGYTVTTCATGDEAIERYTRSWQKFDLVLIDMLMPEKSGEATAAELHRINPSVRVLLLSGYGVEEPNAAMRRSGVRAVVQKPFTIADLTDRISEALAENGKQ